MRQIMYSLLSVRQLVVLLVAVGAVACSSATKAPSSPSTNESVEAGGDETPPPEPCTNWISGREAQEIIREGGLLLDVRTAEEFAEGHLDGAVNIAVQDLESRLNEVPEEQHVVVYCQSGRRAHQAALLLDAEGRQVSEIGTMAQWEEDAQEGCSE